MNKELFKEFINTVSEEEIKEYFYSHSFEEFRIHFNLSYANVSQLKKMYNIYYSDEYIQNKKKDTWKKKSEDKFNSLIEKVSKENLIEYYIKNNNTFEDTAEYFNISHSELIKLLKYYNCKKPKTLSSVHCKNSKLERYGDAGYNNREKAEQTCLERYGVDNPFKDTENMKASYLRHLGVEHPMKSDKVCMKQHETAIKNGLSKSNYGAFGANSKPNSAFKDKLDKLGLIESLESNDFQHYRKEFSIGRASYDFKIKDYLIEINPSSSHNSTDSFFGITPSDYHFNKSVKAWNNGYKCIHIWDWDDLDFVIDMILKDGYKDSKDLDKALFTGDVSSIKPNKYIWDRKLHKLVSETNDNTVIIYGVGIV